MNDNQKAFLKRLSDQLPAQLLKEMREHFPDLFVNLDFLKEPPQTPENLYLWLQQ